MAAFATTVALMPAQSVAAQSAPMAVSPISRWWPAAGGIDGSALSLFGNVVRCTPGRCNQAASLGLDARVVGQFHVAASARMPGFDYAASYGWRHIGVSASLGGGRSNTLRVTGRQNLLAVITPVDSNQQNIRMDTTWRTIETEDTTREAVRWSSAEARLTWHEERWWATALLGRVALAERGTTMWGGLQFGADLGRGAALLLGVGTAPRQLAAALPAAERHNVSLGLGFNTSLLSSRGRTSRDAPADAAARFQLSNVGPGRVRIVIRIPSAASVEFASDCTGWKPLDMTPTRDGWVVEVAATRGLHRANIRIDGGKWITPPGLSSAADEFAGEVGIFVIE